MYEFGSKIRYSETDSEGKLSLDALLNYFQDASTFHSESLGVGLDYTKSLNLAWVLSSWQIVVKRYPKLCEDVIIGTFPYDFKGCMGGRNFYMKDATGEYVAYANSVWTLVDMENGKLCFPTEQMLESYVLSPKLEMEYAPRKISVPKESGEGVDGEWMEEIVVKQHHLDTNHHVNNGQYIRMALNLLPEGLVVTQMRAEYKKQAFLNDVLKPWVVKADNRTENGAALGSIYTVSLRDTEGKPYVNVEFTTREE